MRRSRLASLAALGALAMCAGGAVPGLAGASTRSGGGSTPGCARGTSFKSGSGGTQRSCRHHVGGAHANCLYTRLRPRPWNAQRIRYAVLCLVNRERARHGEGPLRPNLSLRQAAQRHSDSMARGGYFAHDGPGGTPLSRIRATGYMARARGYEIGENIAYGTLWLSTPRAIVSAWMHSPGHRANILDGHFRDTAVGVSAHLAWPLSHGQPGAVYTQDFGVVTRGR